MPRTNRARTLLLIIAAFLVATYLGPFALAVWREETGTNFMRVYGDPKNYAPSFAPTGDWLVVVDAPATIRNPLIADLKLALPGLTADATRITVDAALPATTTVPNIVYIKVTPGGFWTPFFVTYHDKVELKIMTGNAPGQPIDSQEINAGELEIDGDYDIKGNGIGLIGRVQANARRASLLTKRVADAINQGYAEIRQKAGQ